MRSTPNAFRPLALTLCLSMAMVGCPASEPAGDPASGPPPDPFGELGTSPSHSASTADEVDDLRDAPIEIVPAAEVGTLPGSSSVDRFGKAHYTIPLTVAPGVRGMQPALALRYSSSTTNGHLGIGFALAGLSRLQRCPDSVPVDGRYDGVEFDLQDALCLDGNRLVRFAGLYGQDGSEYRLRHDTFAKIVLHGNIQDRESWFEVFRKDGRIQRYGAPESWIHEQAELPIAWLLSQDADRFGNAVDYDWEEAAVESGQAGEMRIAEIAYGGIGTEDSRRHVRFEYEARPDAREGFFFGVPTRSHQRLAAIVAEGPYAEVHSRYELDYDTDAETGRSEIESVRRCDRFGMCMPATDFEWVDAGSAGFSAPEFDDLPNDDFIDDYAAGLAVSRQSLLADFDGDGVQDLLYRFLRPDTNATVWRMWSPFAETPYQQISVMAEDDLPRPPDITVAWIDTWLELGGFGLSPVHRLQPPLQPVTANHGMDRRQDLIAPLRASGSDGADAAGHPVAHRIGIWHGSDVVGQPPPPPGCDPGDPPEECVPEEPPLSTFPHELLDTPTGQGFYAMIPVDHDGNGLTDLWLCQGDGYKSGHWVLALAEATVGATSTDGFSFHDAMVGCSAHDEVQVVSLEGGGRQSLLVVPAYETNVEHMDHPSEYEDADDYVENYAPIPEADRGEYRALVFEPGEGPGTLVDVGLPRDLYQRWHDRFCRNSVADEDFGYPLVGAGHSLDKQMDVNGDGLVDIMRFELASGDTPANLEAITAGLGDGDWNVPAEGEPPASQCGAESFDDTDSVIRVYWNTGAGFEAGPVAHTFDASPHAALWLDFVGAQIYDIEGNGTSDLLVPSLGDEEGWKALRSMGDGTFVASTLSVEGDSWPAYRGDETAFELVDEIAEAGGKRLFAADVQIHQRPALFFTGVTTGDGVFWNGYPVHYEASSHLRGGERVATVVDGLGARTEFVYERSGSSVSTVDWPQSTLRGPLIVAAEHRRQLGPGSSPRTTWHSFTHGSRDALGGRFLGFRHVSAWTDGRRTQEERAFPYDAVLGEFVDAGAWHGRSTLFDMQDEGGDTTYEHLFTQARLRETVVQQLVGGPSWFTYTAETERTTYSGEDLCPTDNPGLGGWLYCSDFGAQTERTHRTTTRARDSFGTLESETTTDDGGSTTTSTASEIGNDTGDWLIGEVGRTEVTDCTPAADCETRVTTREFDPTTGIVLNETIEPGTDLELRTYFTPDAYGNIAQQHILPATGTGRLAWFDYDTEGAVLESTTNTLGHVSWVIADPVSGAVVATIDPNGITAVNTLDGFFRPIQTERRPTPMSPDDGAPALTSYLPGEPTVPLSAMRVQRDMSGGQRIIEDIANSRHVVRTTWYGMLTAPAGGAWTDFPPGDDVVQVNWYDRRGRLTAESLPAWAYELDADGHAPHETQHEYDERDRRVRRIRPNGATDEWSYEERAWYHIQPPPGGGVLVTHTDPESNVDERERDVLGRVVRTVDAAGTPTCLDYGPFGRHEQTEVDCGDTDARVTEWRYDARGRVTLTDDPAADVTRFAYNGFDELVWTQDGEGAQTDWVRDDLGRPITRTDDDGVATWEWDTHLVGAIAETSTTEVDRAFHYDEYGRLSSTLTHGALGPAFYDLAYEYDAADRLTRIEFPTVNGEPDPHNFEYDYDDAGYLRAVRRGAPIPAFDYWRAHEANAAGQVVQESFSSGAVTNRIFEPETLRPERITTTSLAAQLQLADYTWTPSGDLLTREDLLHDQHETFEHDALHRLVETDVTQGPAQLVQSVTYNEFGDIRTKSDVGSYLYQGTTGRLLRYGSPQTVLAYDQNGRVTVRGDQTLDYTAQGKVATLDGPGVSLEMIYDADGQRVGRHDSANGGMVVALDGVYERRFPDGLGEHRARYLAPLPSGSAIRVERTWDGGPAFSEETHFVHGDYLGSGEVVTDITGAVLAEASFDPWGAARDPEDWTSVLSEPALVELGVGFTGHRAELDGGLVNMGGRMYDPVVGRFTAPDPVVVDAANGQAYNRYAYVMNRPLRLVDPSGYAAEDPHHPDNGDDDDPDDGGDEPVGDAAGDAETEPFDFPPWAEPIVHPPGGDNGPDQTDPPDDDLADNADCSGRDCIGIAFGPGTDYHKPQLPPKDLVIHGELYAMGEAYAEGFSEVAEFVLTLGTGGGVVVLKSGVKVGGKVVKEAAKHADDVVKAAKGGATKRRVKLRKGTRKKIETSQPRNSAGEMVDPNTGAPLKPREIDVGHKPGQEWRHRKKMHEERGSTRQEVLDAENDPNLYHLEDRTSNRSHRFEGD